MWRQMGHRTTWMVIAVFLPEMVLYCAWEQWWAARMLRTRLGELVEKGINIFTDGEGEVPEAAGFPTKHKCGVCREPREDRENTDDLSLYHLDLLFANSEDGVQAPEEHSVNQAVEEDPKVEKESLKRAAKAGKGIWTTQQAFFALTGGFAVDSSGFMPYSRLTFTPAGLVFLAKLGLLPDEPAEAVADRSKADYVAKVLVCLQAGWFFVQCIGRVAQKLPLTILELHVLVHVLCAFGMYLLWLDKPYDVGSPVLCKDERVVNLAALFALRVEPVSVYHGLESVANALRTSAKET